MKTGWFTPTDFSLAINCLEHRSLLGPPKGRVKKATLRGGMMETRAGIPSLMEDNYLSSIGRVHPEGISLDPEIFGIEGHPEGHSALPKRFSTVPIAIHPDQLDTIYL